MAKQEGEWIVIPANLICTIDSNTHTHGRCMHHHHPSFYFLLTHNSAITWWCWYCHVHILLFMDFKTRICYMNAHFFCWVCRKHRVYDDWWSFFSMMNNGNSVNDMCSIDKVSIHLVVFCCLKIRSEIRATCSVPVLDAWLSKETSNYLSVVQ